METHASVRIDEVSSVMQKIVKTIKGLRHQEEMDELFRKREMTIFGVNETVLRMAILRTELYMLNKRLADIAGSISVCPWKKAELIDLLGPGDRMIGGIQGIITVYERQGKKEPYLTPFLERLNFLVECLKAKPVRKRKKTAQRKTAKKKPAKKT